MVKKIDLNDWVLSGGGGAGVSYFHKTDPNLILKVENRQASLEEVENSLSTARIVFNLGIPTPEPGEVVFDGEHYGQIFRRIQGKVSFARLIGEHPEMIPQLAHEYTQTIQKMHSTIGAGTGLRSIKEVYGDFIRGNKFQAKEVIDKALKLMESLPDADTCVHGDLHFGNLIKAEGKNYLIDIGSFAYGHPYFDIAMMVAIRRLAYFDPQLHFELFHHSAEQGNLFWDCFIKEYFGEDATFEKVFEKVLPFLVVRILTMETETGHPIPEHETKLAKEYLYSI